MHLTAIQTIVVIVLFAITYMTFIIRKTAHRQLDLYDLLMLSMVAIVPTLFALFPRVSHRIAQAMGVEFPFVVMFGLLFVILFIFIHRLTVKIHQLESDSRLLVQELSMLRLAIENENLQKNIDEPTTT